MSIIVRVATADDIEAIGQLYDDLNDYLETHENFPRWKKGVYPIREDAEEAFEKGDLYVAEIDGNVAGTVVYSDEQEDAYRAVEWQIEYDVPVITICKLAVHPNYFGYGLGKELLDYAECVGKQRNAKAIRLDAYEENIPAIRLYEKCGFTDMGMVDLGLEEIYGLKWYKVFEKVLRPF